jgi:hypothetical protein
MDAALSGSIRFQWCPRGGNMVQRMVLTWWAQTKTIINKWWWQPMVDTHYWRGQEGMFLYCNYFSYVRTLRRSWAEKRGRCERQFGMLVGLPGDDSRGRSISLLYRIALSRWVEIISVLLYWCIGQGTWLIQNKLNGSKSRRYFLNQNDGIAAADRRRVTLPNWEASNESCGKRLPSSIYGLITMSGFKEYQVWRFRHPWIGLCSIRLYAANRRMVFFRLPRRCFYLVFQGLKVEQTRADVWADRSCGRRCQV